MQTAHVRKCDILIKNTFFVKKNVEILWIYENAKKCFNEEQSNFGMTGLGSYISICTQNVYLKFPAIQMELDFQHF